MTLSLPKCGCSDRSLDGRVFTCPVCCSAALRFHSGEGVDQHELFEYLDSNRSVRAMDEDEDTGGLVHVSRILSEIVVDDLPF